ncbi:la-related protein 6-like [Salmo trutta]|uniref:La-related protein 6-like n=1 Tax=Salmo trutta TaxID=8032 RepID=A0A673ZBG4_SALTR|nr:la-related protein 6-like [Salmo trutta]
MSSAACVSENPRQSPFTPGRYPDIPMSPTALSKGDTLSCQDGLFTKLASQSAESSSVTPGSCDLSRQIVSQLECYLSNEHLAEDGFLLKHVQRNRMGYVSLKLLTSFKKMKELTRDWRITLAAALCSDSLEVNRERTKVRRREPLPDWLLSAPNSKLLLAWNLFGENTGSDITTLSSLDQQVVLEKALKLFSVHAAVASLRILRPGKELPVELRRHARRHAELGRRTCAVVEFETLEGARLAYRALQRGGAEGAVVCVVSLGSPGTRSPPSSSSQPTNRPAKKEGEEDPKPDRGPEVTKVSQKNPKVKSRCFTNSSLKDPVLSRCFINNSMKDPELLKSLESDPAPAKATVPTLGSAPARLSCRRIQRHKSLDSPLGLEGHCQTSQRDRPSSSDSHASRVPLVQSKLRGSRSGGVGRSRCSGDHAQEKVACPWVQRQKVAASAALLHPETPGKLRRQTLPLRVVRLPQGPSGTKGFYGGRGRGKLPQQQ